MVSIRPLLHMAGIEEPRVCGSRGRLADHLFGGMADQLSQHLLALAPVDNRFRCPLNCSLSPLALANEAADMAIGEAWT